MLVKDNSERTKRSRDLFYGQRRSGPVDCATARQNDTSGLRIKRGDIKVD